MLCPAWPGPEIPAQLPQHGPAQAVPQAVSGQPPPEACRADPLLTCVLEPSPKADKGGLDGLPGTDKEGW